MITLIGVNCSAPVGRAKMPARFHPGPAIQGKPNVFWRPTSETGTIPLAEHYLGKPAAIPPPPARGWPIWGAVGVSRLRLTSFWTPYGQNMIAEAVQLSHNNDINPRLRALNS